MSGITTADTEASPSAVPPVDSGSVWHLLRRDPRFLIAAFLLLLLGVIAVAPGTLGAVGDQPCDLANFLGRPSRDNWFGFDMQGCEYYSKTLLGARTSLTVGFTVVAFATVIGLVIGTLAGFYEGIVDGIVSRVTDMVLAVPLVLGGAVVLVLVNEPGVLQVALVLTLLGWPPMVRLVRATVRQTKNEEFVMAARALGASDLRLLRRHIVPNAIWPVIAYASAFVGISISAEALLSYMGVGLQLPAVSWGLMLAPIRHRIAQAPHLLIPALFLTATVAAFVLLGESLRRATDPRRTA